jgi:hypothetical protein
MRPGEVRWYRFSRPDKNRPVVILTRDSALDFLGEVTIAPITSTIRDIPSEVLLTKADGMSHDFNDLCRPENLVLRKYIFYEITRSFISWVVIRSCHRRCTAEKGLNFGVGEHALLL